MIENPEISIHGMRFRSALDALEQAASKNVDPAETRAWRVRAEPICEQLERRWEPYRQRLRHTFREIEANDLALAPRVSELRSNRRTLSRRWKRLRGNMNRLSDGASSEAAGTEGGSLTHIRKDLRDWAHSARELDKEATTWLIESVYRERGGSG